MIRGGATGTGGLWLYHQHAGPLSPAVPSDRMAVRSSPLSSLLLWARVAAKPARQQTNRLCLVGSPLPAESLFQSLGPISLALDSHSNQ